MDKKILTAQEIAEMVDGRLVGDGTRELSGFGPLDSADSRQVSFLVKKNQRHLLQNCQAGAVLVPEGVEGEHPCTLIEVKDPYVAGAIVHGFFVRKPFVAKGVDRQAVVGEDCILGKEISIGPLAVIGDRVRIGERVTIEPGVVVGDDVCIGDDTRLCANVTVYNGCLIGSRVCLHAGVVVGADGYGYATSAQGEHLKRPQVGIVRIADDVEIGANTCVDRAAYGETLIGAGTKIDNLVQVGHNAKVGESCLLVAQVGIAGSTTLGRNVVMAGHSAVAGHLHIGDRAMVAAKAGVHTNLEEGAAVGGIPAIPVRQWARCSAVFAKLPEIYKQLKRLDAAVNSLIGQPKNGSIERKDND
ncbi:MAG: UDP-3-O-(3-hydroxymyristoyl)glucosamine N-acyltransferase [Deltaproteobacteria bacterium]|nr:MAG: UDP-3-O-(3-hydroxymyristoyl)glucosamine N-acyltransferase [Deltaproteobacteria bacterium]